MKALILNSGLGHRMGFITNPYAARDIFTCMLHDMDLKHPVSSNREKELDDLTNSVNPIRLKNNPVVLIEEAIKTLYESILR